jgi:hypothetical protein
MEELAFDARAGDGGACHRCRAAEQGMEELEGDDEMQSNEQIYTSHS